MSKWVKQCCSIQKLMVFLYTSKKQLEIEINKIKSYEVALKIWNKSGKFNKICARSVHWKLQYITREIKKHLSKREVCLFHGSEDSILLRCQLS